MPAESYAAIPPNSTGPQVRTEQVQTIVQGVPLTVDMQVMASSDSVGVLQDLDWRAVRRDQEVQLLAAMNTRAELYRKSGERGSLIDRRGCVGRGTSR